MRNNKRSGLSLGGGNPTGAATSLVEVTRPSIPEFAHSVGDLGKRDVDAARPVHPAGDEGNSSTQAEQAEVMTVQEAADFLRVNHKTLRDAISRGDVPGAVRLGRAWRLSRTALVRWLEGSTSPALGEDR